MSNENKANADIIEIKKVKFHKGNLKIIRIFLLIFQEYSYFSLIK